MFSSIVPCLFDTVPQYFADVGHLSCTIKFLGSSVLPFFGGKLRKMSQNLLYAAIMINPFHTEYFYVLHQDFPKPDLGSNNGPFSISKLSKNFPKCLSLPIS